MRREAKDREKIFAKDTFGKDLSSKMYNGFFKLNNKITNNLI